VFEINSIKNHSESPASSKPISNPIMLSIKQRFFNPVQNYFAVTILVNASKPRFKGSYSDVRRSPHRIHSVSVRRGPHKKRLPNNQCSIVATAAGRVECAAAL